MSDKKVLTLSPNVCFDTDVDNSEGSIEIALPGVKKDDITLKINENGYSLSAGRRDTRYVASDTFCCPVIPDKTKAKYNNGLLSISVKFKDTMKNAVRVKVA